VRLATGSTPPLRAQFKLRLHQHLRRERVHARRCGGRRRSLFAVLVGTFVWDFLQYWQHRLYHGSKTFWQMHLLHHCDKHVNVTTAARHHVFENLLAPVFVTIPTAILFQVPPVDIAILSLLPFTWQYFTHANINLGFGPLWWLLVSPNYHRTR